MKAIVSTQLLLAVLAVTGGRSSAQINTGGHVTEDRVIDTQVPKPATTQAALPDLIVTDVAWAPTKAVDGEAVTFTVTVKNVGDAPTPEGTIVAPGVYVNGGMKGFADTYTRSLGVNESVALKITSANWIAITGSHVIRGRVDDVNRIPEKNEKNNWYDVAAPLVVGAGTPQPDLVVTSLTWSPDPLEPGHPIRLGATIKNIGTLATAAGVIHGVRFYVNDQLVSWADQHTSSIKPGREVTVLSSAGPEGKTDWKPEAAVYSVKAVLDEPNLIAERKEDNNSYMTKRFAVGQIQAEAARPADAMVDSIGVGIHSGFYGTAYDLKYETVVKPKLVELGVRHLRDGASRPGSLANTRQKELAALGMKSIVLFDPRYTKIEGKTPAESLAVYVNSMVGIMELAEGPNEYNWGGKDPNWVKNLREFQELLYETVKNNPATSNIPVVAPSIVMVRGDSEKLGDISQWVDYGNMHPYPGARVPSFGIRKHVHGWDDVSVAYPGKPMLATETGYHTMTPSDTGHVGVSEGGVGKYMPRMFLEYFNAGVTRMYAYEFIDLMPDSPPTNHQWHFGMLRNDGSEKPSYTGLRNLIGLLKDPGDSFTPASLTYSLSGDTEHVHHTLLQKRDGSYYLALWVDALTFNPESGLDIDNTPRTIYLKTSQPAARVSIHGVRTPVVLKEYANTDAIRLRVPDEVVIVKIEPQ